MMTIMMFSSFLLMLLYFMVSSKLIFINLNMYCEIIFYKLGLDQNLSMMFNKLELNFFILVMFVSSMIFLYSIFYMGHTFKSNLYSWLLLYFVLSMLVLISSSNIMMTILGWDGLGVSSFLLVIFYINYFSLRSGMATFITNRLGDMFLILALILLFYNNIMEHFLSFNSENTKMNYYIFMFIVLSSMTKSAQLPFSAWLPAAMAAPTPISSLVHSSTLVTAGVYMTNQFFMMFSASVNFALNFCFLAIMLSMLAGFMAYLETDFKKMIAMSTLSQLGIMMYILSSKSQMLTLFHIISHAFFKSMLFLTVGLIIFFNLGAQDMRMKCSMKKNFFLLNTLFVCCSISLMGFPFTSGFFSKDNIILENYSMGANSLILLILVLACVMTVMYSFSSINLLMNFNSMMNTFNTFSITKWFFISTMTIFPMMMVFGKLFFFYQMDTEVFTENLYKKLMGVMILFMGFSMNSVLKYFNSMFKSNPYIFMSDFFLSMTNMNWFSNNMMTKIFSKNFIFMKSESVWWEYVTNKMLTNTQNYLNISNLLNFKNFSLLVTLTYMMIFMNMMMM